MLMLRVDVVQGDLLLDDCLNWDLGSVVHGGSTGRDRFGDISHGRFTFADNRACLARRSKASIERTVLRRDGVARVDLSDCAWCIRGDQLDDSGVLRVLRCDDFAHTERSLADVGLVEDTLLLIELVLVEYVRAISLL